MAKIGKRWFQRWEPLAPRTGDPQFNDWEASVPKAWEPALPRTGNPWFQDWETLVTTLGNRYSYNWEPVVQDREELVPTFGNR